LKYLFLIKPAEDLYKIKEASAKQQQLFTPMPTKDI
jgi:hypothetical protein